MILPPYSTIWYSKYLKNKKKLKESFDVNLHHSTSTLPARSVFPRISFWNPQASPRSANRGSTPPHPVPRRARPSALLGTCPGRLCPGKGVRCAAWGNLWKCAWKNSQSSALRIGIKNSIEFQQSWCFKQTGHLQRSCLIRFCILPVWHRNDDEAFLWKF